MRNSKIYIVITVILFWLLLAVPGILIFTQPTDQLNSENRALAEMPEFNLAKLDKFPHKFDNYVNDHFPFRSAFLHYFFLYSINHDKSPISSVIIGKDDFLFCGLQERELYEGTLDFTEERMAKVVRNLADRQAKLLQDSIRFYVVVAPTAYEIYPEYLPEYMLRTEETATDRFCRTMAEKAPQVPVLYLKDKMLEHKKAGRVYHKNDNHWNYLGSEYATEDILNFMAGDFPQLPRKIRQKFTLEPYILHRGNLHNMLAVNMTLERFDHDTEYCVHYVDSARYDVREDYNKRYKPLPDFSYPWDYERRFTTNRTQQPKIVVIRDSFGGYLKPFLTPWFRESVFIFDDWLYQSNDTIIQQEKPDIVLLMIYEPYLRKIANE